MTAGDLALILAATLLAFGFAALIVVLLRVLDTLRILRSEVDLLRRETGPLLSELRISTQEARFAVNEARDDLHRFDRVLGSAEAITDAVSGTGRVTRLALSTPFIKMASFMTGTTRVFKKLSTKNRSKTVLSVVPSSRSERSHTVRKVR